VKIKHYFNNLFRSADKIYEVEAVPLPFYMCRFTCPPPPSVPVRGGGGGPITQSHFWPPMGEGGDQYNITTCRMAEGSKGTCISHVDALHGEWPRIESSLLFCNFFILSKSYRKAYFLRVKLGSLER